MFVWARRVLNSQKRRFPARAGMNMGYTNSRPTVLASGAGVGKYPSLGICHGGLPCAAFQDAAAGLDEGFLQFSLSNILYMENPYNYRKFQ